MIRVGAILKCVEVRRRLHQNARSTTAARNLGKDGERKRRGARKLFHAHRDEIDDTMQKVRAEGVCEPAGNRSFVIDLPDEDPICFRSGDAKEYLLPKIAGAIVRETISFGCATFLSGAFAFSRRPLMQRSGGGRE